MFLYLKYFCESKMFVKTFCLLLVVAVVAYGLPYQHGYGGNVDPGFGRYPNQGGFAPDAGFGGGHGQGGFPGQGGFVPDPGFGHGGQGGLPSHDSLHYGGGGDQHGSHHHGGYKQYGY